MDNHWRCVVSKAYADGRFRDLFAAALACLRERDPEAKQRATRQAAADWRAGRLALDESCPVDPLTEPGRPARPELVHPRDLAKRSARASKGGGKGRAALIHAVAHIEFNAINLAWDAVQRFRGLPRAYYDDWVRVADEEALHFGLMRDRLRALGFDYGDFPAHDGLWSMAERTQGDILARVALVPRTLEARGLDASPAVKTRLVSIGDHRAGEILDIILRDEIGHVAIGNHWYGWLCAQRGLDPVGTYAELTLKYEAPKLKGPFNLAARRAAGFSDVELAALAQG